MYFSRACCFLVSLAVVAALASFEPVWGLTFPLTVGGEKFELEEVDVGEKYGCPVGAMVGVILKDEKGFVRWSFNVGATASYLAINGCKGAGTSAATVVGVAVPRADTAVWVIQELSCGASCYGYDVHVFTFHPLLKKLKPNSGEYDSLTVGEDIQHKLGLGGVKFAFPRLVLYVNNGYHECPSHFTKMVYEWTSIDNSEYFILTNAVAYTSRQCDFNHSHWPPEPGE